MADFFDFNFNVVPDAQNSSSGSGSSYDNNETGRVINKPESYFFTEPGFKQIASNKSFGPINENEFQITTTFNSNIELKAYAVTSGTLFYAQFGESENTVNIILKPTKDVGLGLKIKYFVYRGIKAGDIFVTNNGLTSLKGKDDNILDFLTKVWYDYIEYNDTEDDFTGDKIGYMDSSATAADILKQFFAKDKHNLLHVKAGTHIGNFIDGGGFEIVLDEGDFEQEKSDTGLMFDESFARAKECILKVDGTYPTETYIFGGNSLDVITNRPKVSPKIFRENVYKFLDPAAFYGSHVTSYNKGTIKIKNDSADKKTIAQVFEFILNKFINKNKTYLYIKSARNRSYGFYNNETIKYENTPSSTNFSANANVKEFEIEKWPVMIEEFTNTNIVLSLKNILKKQCSIFICDRGSNSKSNFFTEKWLGTETDTYPITITDLPVYNNRAGSNFIFCIFNEVSNVNNLFGNINLKTIFEKEDFDNAKGSFVNYLRPVLIKDGDEVALYQSKIVLHGDYISSTNPQNTAPSDEILSQNLRTYILFPQQPKSKDAKYSLTAGYYCEPQNEEEYCRSIYGEGEIWKGVIKDGTSPPINSLLYRRKDNDEVMPIYQLGISQKEYKFLEGKAKGLDTDATNVTNFFFNLEEDNSSTSSAFIKHKLSMQFDKKDGTLGTTTDFISLYTIDGYFFFTKDYCTNFDAKYCKEFAETTVEFRPHQDWDGEFGMDWYRKGQYSWANTTGDKIYDTGFIGNVGTLPNQTDGNSYNPLISFLADNKMLAKLKSKEYNISKTSWSLLDNETECFTSWLSLDKGKTAKLNLRIRVKKEAGRLRIRYPKKYFKITVADYADYADPNYSFYDFPPAQKTKTTDISTTPVTTARFFDLELNCIEEFGSTQILEVKADDKLAGVLKVFPNSNKPVQNILFVPVKIAMPDNIERGFTPGVGDSPITANYISNHKNWLVQFLLQSQIKANIEMYNDTNTPLVGDDYKQLNLISDINFKDEFAPDNGNPSNNKGMFTKKDVAGTFVAYSLRAFYEPSQANRLDLKQYLTDHLPTKYTDPKYKSYLIVFFMNIDGYSMSNDTTNKSQLNGYSSGKWTNLLVFKLAADNNETVAHEVYHSLGIPHTFDKTDVNSLYVYKGKQTDNLLDYSHHNPPLKNRRSLFHWQWLIARKNVKK